MTLLLLLACGGSTPSAPPPEPAPVPQAQIGVARAPVGSPAVPKVAQVSATDPAGQPVPPEPVEIPEAKVDQSWLQQPTSHVTAPNWPLTLVEPAMCGDLTDGGPVSADGCVTDELRCGDNLVGHTVGGIHAYDTEFYEKKMCWPATLRHDEGNERVYRLKMPAGEWRAWVTLYSPCSNLNLAAVRHDDDACPTMKTNVRVCEMSVKQGRIADRIELTTQTAEYHEPYWYVIVEGLNQNDGLFSLHVQCSPGLGGPIPMDRLIGGVPN